MNKTIPFILLFLLCDLFASAQNNTKFPEKPLDSVFQGLKFRNIGPFRGGRSVASCGVPGDAQTYYMGSTGGGIWKTTDAGINWVNISDGQLNTGSVGSIAVAPSDPNVIYVGMGEHAIRGVMTSHGDGVYKSLDAGMTWTHIGLANTRHISEIKIDPTNHDVVYIAAQGAAYGESADRGVYKSRDGGATWDKILYTDNTTGAADLTIDPTNPRVLFAAMWDHRRYPWQVRSGGPGSGIHKSADAGKTWQKVSGGLPKEMGKAAVDISGANSNVIYANIEAEGKKGGVYRSDDGGKTWVQTSNDRVTVARAWYYIEIFADPTDENTVYVLNAPVLKSIDAGKSFKTVSNPHGDQHHMWINPQNSQNIILSNDGGACVTFNGGNSWSSQENQPTIQFYRVITDHLFPYNIYGGQQDNSSIVTKSRTTGSGITWKDWFSGPGCESAFLAFDPDNPQQIFGGCYQGNISVMDRDVREEHDIIAYPTAGLGWHPSRMKYRFNWNAPIVASPQDPNIIYHCGNKVLVTKDAGLSWQELSPDLTRNDTSRHVDGGAPYTNEGAGGEVYNTISYLEASIHSNQVLWTGSDCGLVHITRNGGANWSNVTPKDLGEALINCIDVSPHDPASAYVVATKYKFNDFSPMIYYTSDYGKSWKKIITGIEKESFARVVREDEKTKGLLYAGTETGLYISYNNGTTWEKFQLNLPICPITDLTFADNDLVVATSGRSFWILDDLTAIQEGRSRFTEKIYIYTPKDSYRINGSGNSRPGTNMGQNPASGITFDYYLPSGISDSSDLDLDIVDAAGQILQSFSSKAVSDFKTFTGGPSKPSLLSRKQGVNRSNWDMKKKPIAAVDNIFLLGGYDGAMVPPGEYTFRLRIGDQTSEMKAKLLADPRIKASMSDYQNQYNHLQEVEMIANSIQESVAQMREVKTDIEGIKKVLKKASNANSLIEQAENLTRTINLWEEDLIQKEQKTFQDVINFPNRLNAEAVSLLSRMGGMNPHLTEGMKQRLKDLKSEFSVIQAEKERIVLNDFKKFNEAFKSSGIEILIFPKE